MKLKQVMVATLVACGVLAALDLWAQTAGSGSYAQAILSRNPLGYWRLNETDDPSGGTLGAVDASTNHLDGTYGTTIQNGFGSIAGPRPPSFPGFEANNFGVQGTLSDANSYVAVPIGNLGTNAVTFTIWLNPSGAQGSWTGILMSRGGPVEGGVGFNDKGMLAYTWNNNSTWSFNSGLVIPQNQWSFVAVAIEPTKATLYLNYVDANTGKTNFLSSVNATTQQVQGFGTGLWRICQDFTDGTRNFVGTMDEVAVFKRTLSSSEITALFVAGLGINAVPPAISQAPVAKTVYAGRPVHFTTGVSGTPAPALQWQVKAAGSSSFVNLANGTNVSGATNAVLMLSNVTSADAGDYQVVATNPAGSVNSATATLTVLPAPTLGNYANAVYTNRPAVYWRFNEAQGATNVVDLMGDMMGGYSAGAVWGSTIPGPSSPAFPGFEAGNTAVQTTGDGTMPSWVSVPTPALTTNAATFITWINPSVEPEPDNAGIFLVARDWTPPGLLFTTGGQLGYQWNQGGTIGYQSGLIPAANQWSMVALVVEPTKATIYLGANGVLTNVVNQVAHNYESGWGLDAQIGCNYGNTARIFQGQISEVAMFDQALTLDQVNTLYGIAVGKTLAAPPQFVIQPNSTTRYAGLTATFKTVVQGKLPLSYQWYKGNAAMTDGGNIAGAKTDTLVLSNLSASDAGSYKLEATNSDGSATSSVATLTVPASTAAYEKAVLSAHPVAYWRLNETGDPSSGALAAPDYVAGFDGTYGTAAQNGFNSVAGPRPADGYSIFETGNNALRPTGGTAQSWVTAPQPGLNSNTATFAMWIYPEGAQASWSGLLMNRSGDGEGVGYNDQSMLAYTWNNNSTWSYVSGLVIPDSQWSFVAVAIDPNKAILYLANKSGVQTATNAVAQQVEAWGGTASIGADGTDSGRVFNGIIDEVAIFNYTLTPQQVLNLYNGVSQVSQPRLSISAATAGQLTISWDGPGKLQSTAALKGAQTDWSDAGTTSPVTITPSGTAQFYRVLVQP